MFEFFKEIAEGIGFKLIDNFSDKVAEWIKSIFEEAKTNKSDKWKDVVASSGNYAQVASSGYSAKVASSGDSAQVASSGDSAKVASSGDSAQVASSGDSAQVASSGDSAQVASSGYSAKVASSGYSAQVASSGDSAKVASSGDYAQVASSGDYAQVASSGDSAKVASSGDSAQVASSGDYAQVASSGDSAKVVISGEDSVGFICGINNIIKGIKGTWISITEYGVKEKDNKKYLVPIYALSAQIGNTNYRDYRNRILKEDEFYCLYNKKFHPVDLSDGIRIVETSRKVRDGIEILKGIDMRKLYDEELREIYIAKEGDLSAHGYTLREAIDDLTFKKIENTNVDEIVKEIRKTGKVTRSQYRIITGACSYGTNKFCEEHKIEDIEEIELSELRKILIDDYGAEKFWNLIDG